MMMSFAALTILMVHIAIFGTAHEADEGAAAHVWQLLMVAQLPVMIYFALRWFPGNPRKALPVLVVQIGTVLAATAPVFFLKL